MFHFGRGHPAAADTKIRSQHSTLGTKTAQCTCFQQRKLEYIDWRQFSSPSLAPLHLQSFSTIVYWSLSHTLRDSAISNEKGEEEVEIRMLQAGVVCGLYMPTNRRGLVQYAREGHRRQLQNQWGSRKVMDVRQLHTSAPGRRKSPPHIYHPAEMQEFVP